MILADTNIISTLQRVEALDLLRRLTGAERLYVAPATYKELRRAVEAGCRFLVPTLIGIQEAVGFDLVELTRAEVVTSQQMPSSLGAGEAESIAICVHRPRARLVTNDRRARNYCRERKLPCLDLPMLLRGLWLRRVVSKDQVRMLVDRIEQEPGMVIKNQTAIFE